MNQDDNDYNDVLIDKMLQWRSLPSYSDSALRFFCEAEMNPGREELYLQKAQVMAVLELARQVSLMSGKGPR
jgi:hypothetical protein